MKTDWNGDEVGTAAFCESNPIIKGMLTQFVALLRAREEAKPVALNDDISRAFMHGFVEACGWSEPVTQDVDSRAFSDAQRHYVVNNPPTTKAQTVSSTHTVHVLWGSSDGDGTWSHNPNLEMSRDEQWAQNVRTKQLLDAQRDFT